MSMDMDYTEDDRWDWDRNDANQYCKHGTFIGSWWGPDLMCGACEMGDPDPTVNEMKQGMLNDQIRVFREYFRYTETLDDLYNSDLDWTLINDYGWGAILEALLPTQQRDWVGKWNDRIEEASHWSKNDNDDNWTGRRYSARMREYENMDKDII